MLRLALLAVFFLAGCAAIDRGQCASAYDVGWRDGIMGLQPQDNLFGPACERQGASLDRAVYRQGWLDGKHEFDKRTPD